MKKILIVLCVLLLTTGCTIVRIDTDSTDNIIDVVLSKENKLYNQVGRGYKYYIPKGVSYIDTNDTNDKLYSDGIYYYLYVDVINYYNNKEYKIPNNENHYYFKEIDVNGKKGYVDIVEENDQYFIKFVYNYATLEAKVKKDEINEVILNASYILSTVKFNDNIVELLMNGDFLKQREEEYGLFKSNGDGSTLLKYSDENGNEIEESNIKDTLSGDTTVEEGE